MTRWFTDFRINCAQNRKSQLLATPLVVYKRADNSLWNLRCITSMLNLKTTYLNNFAVMLTIMLQHADHIVVLECELCLLLHQNSKRISYIPVCNISMAVPYAALHIDYSKTSEQASVGANFDFHTRILASVARILQNLYSSSTAICLCIVLLLHGFYNYHQLTPVLYMASYALHSTPWLHLLLEAKLYI